MHREVQQLLREGFPTLFERRDAYDGSRTLTFVDVGDGWTELMICAASVVVGHEEAVGKPVADRTLIRELSEKHGELRVSFVRFSDLFAYDVFSYAERLSGALCELCGYPGRPALSRAKWQKTLCVDCADAKPFNSSWRFRPHMEADRAHRIANVIQCELRPLGLTAKQEAAILTYAAFLIDSFDERDAIRDRLREEPRISRISLVAPEGVPEFRSNVPLDISDANVAAVALTQFYCAHTAWRAW